MLLKKERLTQMEHSRVQNQNWKDEIARQILEKELLKQNEKKRNDELARIEDEKIRKYQQQITDRIQEGSYSRGKKDKSKIDKNMQRSQVQVTKRDRMISSQSVHLKHKDERIKTNPTIKKSSFTNDQEQIPLFSFAENNNPQQILHNKIKSNKPDPHDDQIIVLSFPEEATKKQRKSTSKKRQETVNSRRNTESSNVFEIDALQQQNKKLKQQLHKSNTIIQNLMKMIKAQSNSSQVYKHAENILEGNEIGDTEYVKFDYNSAHNSPGKILFPSLDFKSNSLIRQFNIGAAKKAKSLNSIELGGQQQ